MAHRTAASPPLIDRVRERAKRGPCKFTLLVPQLPPLADPDTEEPERTLELAIPLLEEATGGRVEAMVGDDDDPVVCVRHAHAEHGFDEVIVSTLPARVSRWLHLDVEHRIAKLGLPVTVVTAKQASRPITRAPVHGFGGP